MTQGTDARLAALQRRKLELVDTFELIKLNLEIADLARRERGDAALARDALREVLELDPTHARALEELSALYQQLGEYEGLRELLFRREELCYSDDQRVALMLQIATLSAEMLDDRDAAISALRQVLTFDPMNTRALNGLERLYTMEERWRELVDLLELRVSFISDVEERTSLLKKLAAIYAAQLGDDARASSYLAQLVE